MSEHSNMTRCDKLAELASPTGRDPRPLARRDLAPRKGGPTWLDTDELRCRPCDACGGAGRDLDGDTCSRCRGHGYLPAPCLACGELSEAPTCSSACALEAKRRGLTP